MNTVIESIRQEFREHSDEKVRKSSERFFRHEVKLYGLKAAFVRQVCKKYYKVIQHLSKIEIFSLCEAFWQSGYIEESIIACEWSYYIHKQYKPEDFSIFKRWVDQYVNNWASCDTLCNHTIGMFIEMYPDYLINLKKWAGSDNRWTRRAAAVSLIIPAKKGMFLNDIFEIADILLLDQDDMVQKGYGWMLKVAGHFHQKEVFQYVLKNKSDMPRTALRYAIEKMPEELKKKAMKR